MLFVFEVLTQFGEGAFSGLERKVQKLTELNKAEVKRYTSNIVRGCTVVYMQSLELVRSLSYRRCE